MAPQSKVKLGVLGDALPSVLQRRSTHLDRVEICASGDSLETLRRALDAQPVDVLVFECPAIEPSTQSVVQELMRETRVEAVIVVYGFATQTSLTALPRTNVALMRAPVDPGELQRICLGLMYEVSLTRGNLSRVVEPSVADQEIPPHGLAPAMVAAVAASAPKIKSECPHHLSDLVLGLRAFEDYSATCESQSPADAALHHYLWSITAKARALFEDALVRVAESEGIPRE